MVQHTDGFGTQGQKLATYHAITRPRQFRQGFKLFYKVDIHRFSARAVRRIRPAVSFVSSSDRCGGATTVVLAQDREEPEEQHEDPGADDRHVVPSVDAVVQERIGIPPGQGARHQHHDQPPDRPHGRAETGRPVHPGPGADDQPPDERQDRDHHVQQSVSDQVDTVQVQERPEQEPVHQPGHGDPTDRRDPYDAPARSVVRRVAGEPGRRGQDQGVALHGEVGDEAEQPLAETGRIRLGQHAAPANDEDQLEGQRDGGNERREHVPCPGRSHGRSVVRARRVPRDATLLG